MKSDIKSTLAIAMFGIVAFVLAGCYTIEGAGKDVEAAGEGVADFADRARPYE